MRGCISCRTRAVGNCRADGSPRATQPVTIAPSTAHARGHIPWAIVCHLGFSERRDEGGASEALGQPVKISTARSVILDPLAATTHAPVLGAARKPGGRADLEANMRTLETRSCSLTLARVPLKGSQVWYPEMGPRNVGTRAPPTTQHAERASSVTLCVLTFRHQSARARPASMRPLLRS